MGCEWEQFAEWFSIRFIPSWELILFLRILMGFYSELQGG